MGAVVWGSGLGPGIRIGNLHFKAQGSGSCTEGVKGDYKQ